MMGFHKNSSEKFPVVDTRFTSYDKKRIIMLVGKDLTVRGNGSINDRISVLIQFWNSIETHSTCKLFLTQ